MNVSSEKCTWLGQDAWALENENLRTVIVPEIGAKIVSLFDKRSKAEWLVGTGERPFAKIPYGAEFTAQDMSGWDEMLPTITACAYPVPGAYYHNHLPDHGEIWPLPWQAEHGNPDALTFSVQGKALPYRLTRSLSYTADDTLLMAYELNNLGQETMPYLWSAHPQFACGPQAEIILPPEVDVVCNVLPPEWGWGETETRIDWPVAKDKQGSSVRFDRTGSPARRQARKFFVLPETRVSWAGVRRLPAMNWLRLDWDSQLVPFLGIWVDEGAISHESVVALEPMTGFYDGLDVAWAKKQVTTIAPGAAHTWSLAVRLGTGDQPF